MPTKVAQRMITLRSYILQCECLPCACAQMFFSLISIRPLKVRERLGRCCVQLHYGTILTVFLIPDMWTETAA